MDKPWLREYDPKVPATVDYPAVPLYQFLLDAAAKYPDKPALVFGNVVEPLGNALMDATMSYHDLVDATKRFAAALKGLGVEKGDRVAIHLPNCPQFLITYYATLMVGGIAVPTNPQYVAREITHQFNDSGAKVAVTLSLTYPLVKQVRDDTQLQHVIVANIKEYFPGTLKLLFTLTREKKDGHAQDISGDPHTYWFQDLLAQASSEPDLVTVAPEDTGVLMYTGGTTGVSKGAQLTHRNLVANAIQVRWWMWDAREGQEVMMTALPLFHSYAMTVCMNMTIFLAGTMVLIPNPRVLDHVLKSINAHKPTLFPGVPAMYVGIASHPDIGKYDVSSIRACISGAAGLPPEVQDSFEALTGGKLVEGYGLSEATPVTHCNPIYGKRKEGSWIGIPFPDTTAAIMDLETGEEQLAVGEIGELCIQGPQVMKGYWNMPTETANALRDGWLHTGDIARMDTDGFFQIVDRKKDMILGSGGYNIYPREVEDVLYEHPKVLEAAAAGVPLGADKGERVKAYVVVKPGETATEEELIAYCRENLAPYKVPKYVEFRDELPKTMVGKILRRVLIEDEIKRLEA
jgi:long-chain acyl-CoA synthetase